METFVIRVWTPGPSETDEPLSLRGLVEHVRFGEQRVLAFESGEQLLTWLLQRAMQRQVQPSRSCKRLDRPGGHRLHGQQQHEELGEGPTLTASELEGGER